MDNQRWRTEVVPCGEALASLSAWRAEIEALDTRSYEYRELSQLVADLAVEAGVELPPCMEDAQPQDELPPGFVSAVPLDEPLDVPRDQFRLIPPLHRPGASFVVQATQLTTDDGRDVRLVDLRPTLAGRLADVLPSADEAERLDSHFYHDLRQMVERGKARNVVRRQSGAGSGPCYTRYVGSKARSFWSPVRVVEAAGRHVLTVARLAECGNDASKEVTLYRRLFGITMRGIK